MKRIHVVMVFFFFAALMSLNAQIYVNSEGKVGIGTETISDNSKLRITNNGLANGSCSILNVEYVGTENNVTSLKGVYSKMDKYPGRGYGGDFYGGYAAVVGRATGTTTSTIFGFRGIIQTGGGTNYAVHGSATGTGTNYGVYGYATSGSTNYGVYGYASGTNSYAGYFQGNIYCTTVNLGSDRKLKKNIENLDNNILTKLKNIKPRSYEYKTEEYSGLPVGKSFGFVAQELEGIFPELVSTHIMPAKPPTPEEIQDEEYGMGMSVSRTQQTETLKTINYMGLIPVLVEAIQEQQAQIEKLEAKLAALEGK